MQRIRFAKGEAVEYRGEAYVVDASVGGNDYKIKKVGTASVGSSILVVDAVNLKAIKVAEGVDVEAEPDNEGGPGEDNLLSLDELKQGITARDPEAPVGAMDRPKLEARLAELMEAEKEAEKGGEGGEGK